MWSGPRNISTALMRSWEARGDTFVCDEPFYAHYLKETGLPHPGAEEVVARHETDWRKVVAWLTGPVPGGKRIFYQKHMAHHLLPHIDLEWIDHVTNCFLIRDPREMIPSLARFIPKPSVDQTGLPQQVRIYERVRRRSGTVPPVLDARDVLTDPAAILSGLCERLGVGYTENMLGWEPGRRPTDGVWARHWYEAVERSTGIDPYRPKGEEVPDHLLGLLQECDRLYQQLYQHRITRDDASAVR